ncbi:MAG: MFS transporter [Chloroflexota bacterium]|nr:MFS transporter [Chloroflexota bacterium]
MSFIETYSQALRSTTRPVRLFLVSTLLYWLGMTLVQLYLNFYLQSLGLDQGWIGIINATPQLTVVLLTFVIGGISARIGPWRAILLGGSMAGLGVAGTALAQGPWMVIAATVVMGAGGGFMWSNSGPFMMANSKESIRATLFSLQAALGTLTGFVAFMLGGQLPSMFGSLLAQPEEGEAVMRATMLVASGFYALALIPIYAAGKSHRAAALKAKAARQTAEAADPHADGGKRRRFISNRGLVIRLLLPGSLVGLGAGMTIPFMNVYIERKFNVSFEQLGQIFAWTAIATAVALMIQPVLAGRMGKVKSVVLVQGLSLPFLLVLGYSQFFPLVVAALFVRGALMNMGNPVFSAYSMERVPERERATFTSLTTSTWSLGWATGSWFSGTLRDAIGFEQGFNVLWGIMALLYATSMILMWTWFSGHEARQRQAQALQEQTPPGEKHPNAA